MKNIQRMIKSLAIVFATFLIFSIIASIIFSVSALENIFNDDQNSYENLRSLEVGNSVNVLKIDVDNTNIIFETGESFTLKTNSEYIKSSFKDQKLIISEKSHNWFFDHGDNDVVISIPKDFVFDTVNIYSKAGKINIQTLNTKILDINLGAGKTDIRNLLVSENTKIDGGAGKFSIHNSELYNLKMNMGAGKVSLSSKIYGNSKIDCGVGAVDIELIGAENDYKVDIDAGIGSINVRGLHKENDAYGIGEHQIDIDGGVGSIDIDLVD